MASDIPVIQQIAQATWPATYGAILSPEQLTFMLSSMYSNTTLQEQMANGHCFILAYQEDMAIGFAGFSPGSPPDTYQLQKLYVLPTIQGSGAGRALLTEVMQHCRQAGATVLRLNVNRFNKARLFYEKHGFAIIQEADIAIGHGYFMNDFIMERSLVD